MRWKPVLARCLDGSGDFPLYTSSCLCLASCIKRRFLTRGAATTQQREELQMALTLSTKLLWATLIKVKSEHAVTQSGTSHQAKAPRRLTCTLSKHHFVLSLSARPPLGKTEIRQCKQSKVGKWQNCGAVCVFFRLPVRFRRWIKIGRARPKSMRSLLEITSDRASFLIHDWFGSIERCFTVNQIQRTKYPIYNLPFIYFPHTGGLGRGFCQYLSKRFFWASIFWVLSLVWAS